VYDSRLRWPVPADLRDRLVGRAIDGVDRRSKYLLFRFAADTLLVHLGMTGSLRVYRSKPPPRQTHDHVDIVLDDGTLVRYNDPRRFGAMLWVGAPADAHPLLRSLGPEPFDRAFDAAYFWRATRSRTAAIKLALMDNKLVVGVGNIYANESLFRAGIRPTVRAPGCARLARLIGECARCSPTPSGAAARAMRGCGASPALSARLLRLRPGGRPCRVCGRRSAAPAGRPRVVLLSAVPARGGDLPIVGT
jgi:formamidopyrimidine-DNA glycosylase